MRPATSGQRYDTVRFSALVAGCWLLVAVVEAGQWPSLFRGVVVADSSLGVRVVSIEAGSQAQRADLRPEDLIVRVGDRPVRTIDEFAELSQQLLGRAVEATLVVFRRGSPRELRLHLYSYPLLDAWGVEFVPEHDVRFAQPDTGAAYWQRLGRGFEVARQPSRALHAYLNALHQVPNDRALAFKVTALSTQAGRDALRDGRLLEGVTSLRQALVMMDHLFDTPLTSEQLEQLRDHLRDTLTALRKIAIGDSH